MPVIDVAAKPMVRKGGRLNKGVLPAFPNLGPALPAPFFFFPIVTL